MSILNLPPGLPLNLDEILRMFQDPNAAPGDVIDDTDYGTAEDMAFLGVDETGRYQGDDFSSYDDLLEQMNQLTGDRSVDDTDHGAVTAITRDRRPIYEDGTIGNRLTPSELYNLERTGTIDGRPPGGGGGIRHDRFGNRINPDGTVTGRNGENREGYGVAVPGGGGSAGGGGGSAGSGSGSGSGGGQQGGGQSSSPPRFPSDPGSGQGGLQPGQTLGPPFFPGGQGLPPSNIPDFINGGSGAAPGELGGPIQNPQQSADIFDRLLDSFDTANTEANQANESRYNDILGLYGDQLTGANRTLDETSDGLANAEMVMGDRWNRVGSALEAGEGNLERQFGETQGRLSNSEDALQNILAGLGAQDRQDIDKRYDQFAASSRQDAVSRGLGNTSILDTMQRGVQEDRDLAQRRLSRDLSRERVGQGNQAINRGLGLDTLGLGQTENAIGRRSQYGVQGQQFGENTINRMLGQDQNRLAVPANLSTGMLGFMERRSDVGPDLGQLINLANSFGAGGSGDFRPRNIGQQYVIQ